ncbi:MAG: polysaccharide biosynthesis tyrosine autokinase, partial [Alcaligenaceae bacterium]|nr:polysaccharide biosynthesis tyrosine autokinase [Alcaligenaceae bacterium]
SEPLLPRLFGYVFGTETIQIKQLDVPVELENQPLTLVATEAGFDLLNRDGHRLAQGETGMPVNFNYGSGTGTLVVAALEGRPGARYTLKRHSRLATIQHLQEAMVIDEKSKPSGVLAMSLEGADPVQTAAIVNAIGSAYVKQNTERRAAEAEQSLGFLDEFLPQLRRQLDDADNRYTAFRDQHGTFDLGTEGRLSLETSVTMQTRLFELQQRRRELGAQFGPQHPTMVSMNEQIAALEAEVERLSERIKELPALEQQLLNLMRDVTVSSELYAGLLNSAQQLRLVKEGKVGSVRLVDAAMVPERPIKPHKALALAIAGIAGLLLGIALAVLRNLFRPGLRTPTDVETQLGFDVLATVPKVMPGDLGLRRNGKRPNQVLADLAPHAPAIESLRGLRTAMRHGLEQAANNIVMITGPAAGIGKTFTSVNLAAVVGASDKRVLLVDTDFRNGGVHQYFGQERAKGFSELIRGRCHFDEAVRRKVLPNVDMLTTGTLPRNPAEVLLAARTGELLREWSQLYDMVVLDTAPVLTVSDPMALAPHAGTLLLLARAEKTTSAELEESARRLSRAGGHVSGVIFNDFNNEHHRFSARYGAYRAAYGGYPAI